mgnify:CR=1 FL=1
MAVGVVLAFVFGYFTLILNTNPVLAGIALNTLSGGLTVFTTYYLTGNKGSTQSLKSPVMPEIKIPLIKDIPVLGAIISGHNVLTYLGLILVIVLTVFFWKTTVGLRIRAVGENENAAKSVGLNVMKYKYIALLVAGCLAGIGGGIHVHGLCFLLLKRHDRRTRMDRNGGGIYGSRYSMEDRLLGTDLRYGRFTGRTASDVKSAIPAYSDDSLRGYDDRDRNLFEEKYVGKEEELMELFRNSELL